MCVLAACSTGEHPHTYTHVTHPSWSVGLEEKHTRITERYRKHAESQPFSRKHGESIVRFLTQPLRILVLSNLLRAHPTPPRAAQVSSTPSHANSRRIVGEPASSAHFTVFVARGRNNPAKANGECRRGVQIEWAGLLEQAMQYGSIMA